MKSNPQQPAWHAHTLECVHCGFCLAQCPTYRLDKLEQDSPRGRIHLARALAEGRVEGNRDLCDPLDRCLDCRACEAVCPSGVGYHQLLEGAREEILEHLPPRLADRIKLFLLDKILTRPRLLRLSFNLLGLWQALGLRPLTRKLLPASFTRLEKLLPQIPPRRLRRLPKQTHEPTGQPKKKVALFTGCIMTELFGHVHQDTITALLHHDCSVITPPRQFCCGALSLHAGSRKRALQLAALNLRAFPNDVDAIIFNSAGCGAMLKDYGELLADTPLAEEAKQFASKCKEISEYLAEIGLRKPTGILKMKVVYDDACHLCNAQGIRQAPRNLLKSIPGLELVESADPERCCGAAGIYNIVQPEISDRLLTWKIKDLLTTGAKTVATANPGCHLQLQAGLKTKMQTHHPIELYTKSLNGDTEPGSVSPSSP